MTVVNWQTVTESSNRPEVGTVSRQTKSRNRPEVKNWLIHETIAQTLNRAERGTGNDAGNKVLGMDSGTGMLNTGSQVLCS
ncbi:hypothetical protein XELAEV_18023347mg [Xenopus laevis]|uniref:Uncharacterized protein n=1 Tax=Xenopus laevis TaxID=8355 RepID=A0A974D4V9_XENLA|nr:hypothetical protein XELAEV_18023347mg [Xenopus laevis]